VRKLAVEAAHDLLGDFGVTLVVRLKAFASYLPGSLLVSHPFEVPGGILTVISFINLKGGVGKTTTAVAVAEVLAKVHRKSVLFIDLDPQTNATINLIKEEEWQKRDEAGQTLAQLFQDRVAAGLGQAPRFNLDDAIVKQVSTIDGGIARLDLLPSSLKLINIQEKVGAASFADDYKDPRDILKIALEPAVERYDYIIYGETYESFEGLTREIIARCNAPKV